MTYEIKKIAERIRGLRELCELTVEDMAAAIGMTAESYAAHESGESDFSFTFLYSVARKFNIDIVELLTGELPKLKQFSLIRKGEGLPMERRIGFSYEHMAYLFKDKLAEPFLVHAHYDAEKESGDISLNSHEGQEMDYILSGQLKVQIESHTMTLNEGDCIYYDASRRHGMVAAGGDCKFLAIIVNDGGKK